VADTWGGDFIDEHLARQASEDFGTLEFIADIKGEMPSQTRGYHSPLWDDPDKYMHVIPRDPTAHPDDLYAFDKFAGFGGAYSFKENPDYRLEDVVRLGEEMWWDAVPGGKPKIPHLGSAADAVKSGQMFEGGHFYITPRGLTGAYNEPYPGSTQGDYGPGHRRDLYQHELGHSTSDLKGFSSRGVVQGDVPAGMRDEWVQRYEDALYGPSQQMRGEALDYLLREGMASLKKGEYGLAAGDIWAKQVMGLLNTDVYPTPGNVKPTLELPFLIPGNPWGM